jgi:hypothetical protein
MWRRRIIAAAVIVVIAGGGYLVWRLTHPPLTDKEQIEQLIDQIERGIEIKSPRTVLGTIADDYRDSCGYTKQDIRQLSFGLLRTEGKPQVTLDKVNIAVHGDEATADISGRVALVSGEQESHPFQGSLTVVLRKRDGAWRITSTAGWQTQAGEGFEE